jgi:hypothetical protein
VGCLRELQSSIIVTGIRSKLFINLRNNREKPVLQRINLFFIGTADGVMSGGQGRVTSMGVIFLRGFLQVRLS